MGKKKKKNAGKQPNPTIQALSKTASILNHKRVGGEDMS